MWVRIENDFPPKRFLPPIDFDAKMAQTDQSMREVYDLKNSKAKWKHNRNLWFHFPEWVGRHPTDSVVLLKRILSPHWFLLPVSCLTLSLKFIIALEKYLKFAYYISRNTYSWPSSDSHSRQLEYKIAPNYKIK